MTVNLEVLTNCIACVGNAKEVCLARLDDELSILAAVDQTRVRQDLRSGASIVPDQVRRLSMVPIADRDHYLSAVDFVLIRGFPWLDDHGAAESIENLGLVVCVPPVSSYLVDLSGEGSVLFMTYLFHYGHWAYLEVICKP
jgi:hypothetical protein